MSVPLRDVIAALDRAYPPALAHSWDSVGLVCGDPAEAVESVTVAVDATAAVAASVPDGGLLLAHHPLLLRGVQVLENPPAPALQGTHVLMLNGARDPFSRMAPALEKVLVAGGADVDARTIEAGHELSPTDLTAGSEWLAQQEAS